MISCLQKYAGHQLLLPSNGLSLLEAKQVGTLLYYLFAMMDLTEGTFSNEKFAGSILGRRLKVWSMLPDSATVHGLWHRAPLQASTYYWFASLQSLLEIENKWIKTLRSHPEQGFFHAQDGDGTRFLLLDNKLTQNWRIEVVAVKLVPTVLRAIIKTSSLLHLHIEKFSR
jgi:hypothetical protein